jgi:hypothetical protein
VSVTFEASARNQDIEVVAFHLDHSVILIVDGLDRQDAASFDCVEGSASPGDHEHSSESFGNRYHCTGHHTNNLYPYPVGKLRSRSWVFRAIMCTRQRAKKSISDCLKRSNYLGSLTIMPYRGNSLVTAEEYKR